MSEPGSVGLLGDLPDEARELACDGNRDGRALLCACRVEVRPATMQPDLRAPRRFDRRGRLIGLAALECQRHAWRAAVVPRGLDQEAPRVAAAGLGDRALAAPFAGGLLRRHEAEVA